VDPPAPARVEPVNTSGQKREGPSAALISGAAVATLALVALLRFRLRRRRLAG
jgi:hypothetical protein